ncbi:MFS transporter [Flavisolibacter tropicus]|uniref:MFS transporter n=1 Tax=Flavisolibacter tropicus TaxID=1492898 RepID=A0A172U092_9BACT|nr:MFS transporter [Flavisolibacter tropicus]ANE52771.1 MFS transporter [Flavisolibacter tropicus]
MADLLESRERKQRFESLSPLKIKEYQYFIIARFFYIMGLRMVATVVAYQLFQLTKSSFSIGLVGLSEFLPVFSLALYAGYLIDKSDKRKTLLRSTMAYALCVIGFILITSPYFHKHWSVNALAIGFYVIVFFTGVIRAFAGPTFSAIIAQLVPRDILHYAANLSSTSWLTASILGHASAGFFIAGFGVHITFYIILAYILIGVFLISRISSKPVLVSNTKTKAWASVKEGLMYVFQHKVMLGAMMLDLFAVLFGGAVALIPEFADKILQVGPKGFGFLNAAIDIGSAIVMIFATFYPLRRRQGTILFFAVFGFGLCIITFGMSEIYWMSFAALLLAGMLDAISVTVRNTILQLTTPDEMRGRVGSVNSMFINSSNELGQFESGFTSRIFGGAQPAVIFGGVMTTLVVVITWFKSPGLRKFEY